MKLSSMIIIDDYPIYYDKSVAIFIKLTNKINEDNGNLNFFPHNMSIVKKRK